MHVLTLQKAISIVTLATRSVNNHYVAEQAIAPESIELCDYPTPIRVISVIRDSDNDSLFVLIGITARDRITLKVYMISTQALIIWRGTVAENKNNKKQAYWRKNLHYLASLLAVWFIASYGCAILFVDHLDNIKIGGFRLGFWFAQQGSIYIFVVLIFIYVKLMNRLDKKHDVDEEEQD